MPSLCLSLLSARDAATGTGCGCRTMDDCRNVSHGDIASSALQAFLMQTSCAQMSVAEDGRLDTIGRALDGLIEHHPFTAHPKPDAETGKALLCSTCAASCV